MSSRKKSGPSDDFDTFFERMSTPEGRRKWDEDFKKSFDETSSRIERARRRIGSTALPEEKESPRPQSTNREMGSVAFTSEGRVVRKWSLEQQDKKTTRAEKKVSEAEKKASSAEAKARRIQEENASLREELRQSKRRERQADRNSQNRNIDNEKEKQITPIQIAFQTLGLASSASAEQIKQKRTYLLHAHHPDKFKQGSKLRDQAEQETRKIIDAYKTLKNHLGF